MRGLIRFLGNRWVVSVLGFLAIALVIWLLGPFIAIADYHFLQSVVARVVATLLVLVLWLVFLLIRQLRARRAEKQLIDDMAAADQDAGTAERAPATGTAASEEKEELKQRFEEAVRLLRQPREGGRKATSLYELPWYIIFGPPGCGKTTALMNSELDFPLAESLGQQPLGGIGGTRNCDWWITNEAVLIDTAGRYTTQDSESAVDSAAWSSFLDLLKRYRRRRPINGALVAFSITDLIHFDENALAQHCRAIRKRLQELTERIGISIPIYLIFTKADMLAGFTQFFDDLGREERRQVWGTTFEKPSGREDFAALFDTELQALLQRLDEHIDQRLYLERDLPRRALILGFPQQVTTLRENLQRFLRDVFQGSRFEKPILLRGVYFTSGTQEGTPIDRLMGDMAESFGLDRQVAAVAGRGKSYFLTNLLAKVVFREQNLAGSDRKAERIRAWTQRGAYAALVLATVLAALAWARSYTENRVFTQRLEQALVAYEELSEPEIADALNYEQILPRLDALRGILEDVEKVTQSPPFAMRLGLYQGEGVSDAARDAYVRALNALLIPGLASGLEERLAGAGNDPSYSYETLKLYLMLAEPERLDKDLLQFWASDDWRYRFPSEPHLRTRLMEHLEYLLAVGIDPIDANIRLVKQVRDQLERRPLAELVYGRLKLTQAVQEAAPLTLEDIAGRNADVLFNTAMADQETLTIPRLFTYWGFIQLFQPQSLLVIGQLKGEAWVYGPEQSSVIAGQLEDLNDAVLDLYIDEYILRWDNLLVQLDIRSFATVGDGTRVLSSLLRPDSPLKKLLDTLQSNTDLMRLPEGTGAVADIALEELRRKNYYLSRIIGEASRGGLEGGMDFPPKRVKDHFALLTRLVDPNSNSIQLSQIQRTITELHSQLSALEPQGGLSENPFSRPGASQQNVFQKLRTQAASTDDPVRSWLRQIAANAQAVALGDAGERVNEIYKATVAPLCRRLIENRYPFYRSSKEDISVYDFGKLFGDGGLLDTFFGERLAPFVDTAADPWRWRKTAKKDLGVSDASLAEFERAHAIKQAFFPEGGKLPGARFSLIPKEIAPLADQLSIAFGGQNFRFTSLRPSPVDGQWPGPTPSNQLTLRVIALDGELYEQDHPGHWAFYRLVDPGRLRPGSDRFRATFRVDAFRNSFEIHAFSAINPFGLTELAEFRCPEGL